MLSLQEFHNINEAVEQCLNESDAPEFSDDQIEATAYYELRYNEALMQTELHIFNELGESLGFMRFDDPDVAVVYVEETFELEEDELEGLDNYDWAVSDRQIQHHLDT